MEHKAMETQEQFEQFVVQLAAKPYNSRYLLSKWGYRETERWVLEEAGTGSSYRSNRSAQIPAAIGRALADHWKLSDTYGRFVGALSPVGLAKRYDLAAETGGRLEKLAKAAAKDQEALDRQRKHDVPISGAANAIAGLFKDTWNSLVRHAGEIKDAKAKAAVDELLAKAREVHEVLRAQAQVHEIAALPTEEVK